MITERVNSSNCSMTTDEVHGVFFFGTFDEVLYSERMLFLVFMS